MGIRATLSASWGIGGAERRSRRQRGKVIAWVAGGTAVAVVATLAVFSEGYQAQELPRTETAVWVSRDAGQYARVNTETGELDTVRKATEPAQVIQAGRSSVLFGAGLSRAWAINAAFPEDLVAGDGPGKAAGEDATADQNADPAATPEPSGAKDSSGPAAESTPSGTREVLSAGNFFAFRTESGEVFAGTLAESDAEASLAGTSAPAPATGRITGASPVDPLAGNATAGPSPSADAEGKPAARPHYEATQIALAADGTLKMFSAGESRVRSFNIARSEFEGNGDKVPAAAAKAKEPQLTTSGGRWALLDPTTGDLWRQGEGSVTKLEIGTDALLQAGDAQTGDDILIADDAGLWSVAEDGKVTRTVTARGTPAQPTRVDGTGYGAWLDTGAGTLWTGGSKTIDLAYDAASGAADRRLDPVIQTNGTRAVLSERQTGMLWMLPDGTPIPLSQWTLNQPPRQDTGTVVVDDATEEMPPIAVPDSFGVRAGGQTELPVMLNDYDPNKKDVLSIVPESVTGVEPAGFGQVSVLPGNQRLAIQVADSATGTATFSYKITDGTMESETASVTLTVRAPEENSAPVWCGVEGCQLSWPTPQVTPGGTLSLPIMEGWVDPEGDPITLLSARSTDPAAPIRAVATEDGRIVLRHTDQNAPDGQVPVEVTVADSQGIETTRTLNVTVSSSAAPVVEPMVVTVPVGQSLDVNALERVSGGSGSFELVDAVQPQGSSAGLQTVPQQARGVVAVTPSQPGSYVIQTSVRDSVTSTEQTGVIRVVAPETVPALTLPPTRAYVRPLQDTVVSVLDVIPALADRVVTVDQATVLTGTLNVAPIERESLRISGTTDTGAAGLVGTARITVSDGQGQSATGQLTVFQVPETGTDPVIALPDRATVRAGNVVDINVLENDVVGSGERLNLDPTITGSGADGELAFASGNTLRYLAPKAPGTYTVSYTAYQESAPEKSDIGRVQITVLPEGNNRPPTPAALTARVLPGQESRVRVPLSGVDPDGDRVRLVSVESKDAVSSTVATSGNEIVLSIAETAKPGLVTVGYTVRDPEGADGTGTIRVSIGEIAADPGAPITISDSVRLVRGSNAVTTVEPLLNDVDPAQGKLELLTVVPETGADPQSPEYRALADLLDLSEIKRGRVGIHSTPNGGSFSFRYTVRSSASKSTAEGRISVFVSDRVGTQAPVVVDTTLTARDRAVLATTGVDVRTDRVRWAAGDPGKLELSPWGAGADRFTASGPKLIGEYRPEGGVVPFKLAGPDNDGGQTVAYGLLIMPSLDELQVTLRPGLAPIGVDENKSVATSVDDVIERIPGERIELRAGDLPTQRSQATCSAAGNEIRYSAGAEAPWQDRCMIEVRVQGQKIWTKLAVPYLIVPREPKVELTPLSRVVRPGSDETINVATDMIRWQGDRAGDLGKLRFALGGAGRVFQVSQDGSQIRVTARADAPPGTEERFNIDVSGAGEARATLTLRVGDVPRELPRGATVNKQCTVGSGGCRVTAVGIPGEFDPFAGKVGGGLVLDSISASACPLARFGRSGTSDIDITWPAGQTAGGTCTVPFQVRDAQGRLGEGRLEFDAQGLPAAPTSITTVAYTGTSVSLEVALGEAQAAHPAVTGVSLSADGRGGAGRCAPSTPGSYRCEVSGLTNGTKQRFSARAVNAVGESPETTPVTSWAYQVPTVTSVGATTRYDAQGTTPSSGIAVVTIAAAADARAFRIEGQQNEIVRSGATTQVELTLPAGPQTIRVTPLSTFEPPIPGGPTEGTRGEATVSVAGQPAVSGRLALRPADPTTLIASGVQVNMNGAPGSGTVVYRYKVRWMGEPAACAVDGAGNLVRENGDSTSGQLSGLNRFFTYNVRACVSNGFGVASSDVVALSPGGELPPPEIVSGYEVNPDSVKTPSGDFEYRLRTQPNVLAQDGMFLMYQTNGGSPSRTFSLDPTRIITEASVYQCLNDEPNNCSRPARIAPITATNEVTVTKVPACLPADTKDAGTLEISGSARGSFTVKIVPPTAEAPTLMSLVISWTGNFQKLKELAIPVKVCGGAPPAGDSTTERTTP
ncbi:fibronectin type III domain-containing protein [Mycetocola lacteus]|uniref:Fibronectin type III domain-containing protein n=1 Tax=Mycetocola lacteus TaxID=76637 RepID=A0A3L7ANJ7_9MICO|nr:Ig-like domain-containing protein [Mycetocola lacteus]RLP82029.1 fibronectin type III domain-containing protein [Mycetocola lacteus]